MKKIIQFLISLMRFFYRKKSKDPPIDLLKNKKINSYFPIRVYPKKFNYPLNKKYQRNLFSKQF